MKMVNARLSEAGGFVFSASAVFMIAAGLIFSLIVSIFKINEDSDLYLYLNYLAAPVAMTSGILLTVNLKKLKFKEMFPVKCHPKYYLIAVLLIFGLLFSVSGVDSIFFKFITLLGYNPREAGAYFPNLTGGWVILALLVIAVMPAIFEEALFRGVILNTCEKSMGSIRAIFVVGFCFSLFHASPEQTVYQFLAGCMFAFIAIRSGSILPGALMHFLNNGILVVLSACGAFDEYGQLMISEGWGIAITALSAVAFIAGFLLLVFDKKPLVKGDKSCVKNFLIYASVGIGILGLSWLLSFFMS